jgi:hypothetical protein
VFFSTVIYNDADLADAGIWALKQKGVVTLKGDTDGGEVDPRLGMRSTRQSPGQEIRLVLLRDRPCVPAGEPARRHPDHHRLHHQRLRTRHRRRCGADGTTADGRDAKPSATVRSPRTIRACSISTPNTPMSSRSTRLCSIADGRSQFAILAL